MYSNIERRYLNQLWLERGAPFGNQNAAGPHNMKSDFTGRFGRDKNVILLKHYGDATGEQDVVLPGAIRTKKSIQNYEKEQLNRFRNRIDWKLKNNKKLTGDEIQVKKSADYYKKSELLRPESGWEKGKYSKALSSSKKESMALASIGAAMQRKKLKGLNVGMNVHNAETSGFKRPGS